MSSDMELRGAVALVTGAAGGIATAIVRQLAEAGVDIAAVDIDPAGAKRAAEIAEAAGRRALPLEADLADGASVRSAVEKTLEGFGRLDILVNAVGIGGTSRIAEHPEDLWDRILSVNLKSAFLASQAVLPHMSERRSGRIVNITSRAAYQTRAGTAAYAASKGGLLAFSRVLAIEAGAFGITVNNVAPGTTLTPMVEDYYGGPEGQAAEAVASGVLLTPQRLTMPDEIAGAVLYLCGPASDHVTGATIHVNGGSFMA